MRSSCLWRLFSVLLGIAAGAHAATFEVAERHPQASDDGPGTTERPWKTVAKAAEKAQSGDVVVIRGGTYRERVVLKTSGTADKPIRFEAGAGDHVELTGADRLTEWKKADESRPIYGVAWPHKFIPWNKSMAHPADEYHRIIGRCEQVFVEGYLLRQVLNHAQLAPGTFFADVTNKVLFVWDIGGRDLSKARVEASVRQEVLRVEGNYVQVRGLHFRHAANMAQHGAVALAGQHDLLEDCVIEGMNAGGAMFKGEDAVVRRCVFRDNGQLGFSGSHAHRLLFTECTVENNNTKGWDRGWEAGGEKLCMCKDVVLERSRFVRNRGCGVWFDIGNTNCTVRNCLIADNEDAGIFYEISYALNAHDNVIVGNGFAETRGAWGAQAAVCLSSSPYCVIERNLMIGNREGFDFREQTRTTSTIGGRTERAVWNHDQVIRNNIIALNRDAQIGGWFDMKDGRHWPAAEQKTGTAATAARPDNMAEAYTAKSSEGQPQGLTLEKLNLRFENNTYFAGPGQGGFNWGPSWTRHKNYGTLSEFQTALRIDTGSQVFDPGFIGLRQMDFRVSEAVMKKLKESYPQGMVPDAMLGIVTYDR